MSPVELLAPHEATPANPAWHELRRQGISASEIAAVLGISPYQSPFGLYWSKVHGWPTEETPEMIAGRYAEPVIADWFAAECDPHENMVLSYAGLYASGTRRWQLATPDRLIYLGDIREGDQRLAALLECKYLVHGWDGWGEPGTDDIPVHYRAQALQQADVMEVDEVTVAAWHGAEFRTYTVRRDEKDLRVMRAAGRDFMDRLAAGDPPPIDGHTATIAALKQLHPSIEDVDVEVSVEFAEGYRRARQLAARVEAVKDRYEARARHLLGSARRLKCNGHLVCSRSVYEQSGDSAELLALDGEEALVDRLNPGRAASYLTPKKGRA